MSLLVHQRALMQMMVHAPYSDRLAGLSIERTRLFVLLVVLLNADVTLERQQFGLVGCVFARL